MTTARGSRWEGRTGADWEDALGLPAVRIHDTLPSTNDAARAWADAGAPAGAIVLADSQTAGRGRGGNVWWSPPGVSLHVSMILRPGEPRSRRADPGVVALRAGLSLAEALREAYGLEPRIKWPNDVLGPSGRKLAGILCEGALGAGTGWLVAGIGVNVALEPSAFPVGLRTTASSVAAELGRPADRAPLLAPLATRLGVLATAPIEPLTPGELARIGALDALIERLVRVDGGPPVRALGVHRSGALRVARASGEEALVRAGSVRPVRHGDGAAAAAPANRSER